MATTQNAQSLINTVAQMGYKDSTDLNNEFSYGNKKVNILGMRNTGLTLNLRIVNKSATQKTVALVPYYFSGIDLSKNANDLDIGTPFFLLPQFAIDGTTENELFVLSLDANQNLIRIANEMVFTPTSISKMTIRSFNEETKNPETSNFSNVFLHQYSSSWKGDCPAEKLQLTKFKDEGGFHGTQLDVDFVKEGFQSLISQNDALIFQINSGTYMDILLSIGARDSRPEYFQRQVKSGIELMQQLQLTK